MPPPASQMLNADGLWSRPFVPCANGGPSKLTSPNDEGLLQQTACLQILQKPCNRLIHRMSVLFVPLFQVGMLIPPVGFAARARQFDKTYAPLNETPAPTGTAHRSSAYADRRTPSRRASFVIRVSPERSVSSGTEGLHPEGQLVVRDRPTRPGRRARYDPGAARRSDSSVSASDAATPTWLREERCWRAGHRRPERSTLDTRPEENHC